MNPTNDGEKRNDGALEGGVDEEREMIDLFELASENDAVYSPQVEDIFYFGNDSDEDDEAYEDDDDSDEEDEEYEDDDDSEEEDEEYEDDDDSDEEDEAYEDDDDSDEEDEAYEDDDDSDEEDEEYEDDDDSDEEYEAYEDDDDSDEEYEEYEDDDDSDEEDEEYEDDDDSDEEDEEYEDDDDSDEDVVSVSGVINSKWFEDDDSKAIADDFVIPDFEKINDDEASVDLFDIANRDADLPETETHGSFYYWAKRKTVSGWVKFALKCFAVLLLVLVASGVLYFNGLLDLIEYKAADDFKQYYNLSETDYQDDVDDTYSTPVFYNESTTIQGFNESMIDIPKKDVLNILLIGTDVRGGNYEDRGNTDSMILVSVNTRDKNVKLTSFMRDMYVDIPDRQWARLNAAYAYGGPQLLFDTLKKNFDVDVDLYVRVNFANFRKIINHVGGVDIELSKAEARYMNKNAKKYKTDPVKEGWQHLDGAQALSYARCRKIDSDFNRTKRQRTVILALVKEIKGSSPGELNSLLNVFLPMIQTNMSKMQILGLMTDGTRYLNNDIETLNIPIKNSWRSQIINKRDVICPNFELNKTAIVAHIYSTYRLDVESNVTTAKSTTVTSSTGNKSAAKTNESKATANTSKSSSQKKASKKAKTTEQPLESASSASEPSDTVQPSAQTSKNTTKETAPESDQPSQSKESSEGE